MLTTDSTKKRKTCMLTADSTKKRIDKIIDNLLNSETNTTNDIDWLTTAVKYENEKNYDLAEKYYLIGVINNNINGINGAAMMFRDIGEYDKAKEYYLIGVKQNNINSMLGLAGMYANQKQYDDSEKYFLMAIWQDPSMTFIYNLLACVYFSQRKYNETEKYLLIAINNTEEKLNKLKNSDTIYSPEMDTYFLKSVIESRILYIKNLIALYTDWKKPDMMHKYINMLKC